MRVATSSPRSVRWRASARVECNTDLYQYECSTIGGEWLGSVRSARILRPSACCPKNIPAYESVCLDTGGLWLGGGTDCGGRRSMSVIPMATVQSVSMTCWRSPSLGQSARVPEDLDESGSIGVDDLLQVIANWQLPCP